MGGPVDGVTWKQMDESLIKGEKIGVGEAAEKRTKAYEAGRSHGAARVIKCIVSLGINEIWRLCSAHSYRSDMENIAKSASSFYDALAPKLVEDPEPPNYLPTMQYRDGTADAEMAELKVKVTRNSDGSGTVSIPGSRGAKEYSIKDCDRLRSEIEMDVMRHARYFDPAFVNRIIKGHKDVLDNARSEERDSKQLITRTFGGGASERNQVIQTAATKAILRDEDDLNALPGSDQTKLPVEAAKERLQNMLAAFYEGMLALPPEVGRTLDIDMGCALVGKVLDGEITDANKLRAFLDKHSKTAHLADAESQKLFAQFDKAAAQRNAGVSSITLSPTYATTLAAKGGAFAPKSDTEKAVHNFVADLILNEDVYDYDKEIVHGERTGARLNRLVGDHQELVVKLMDPDNRETMLRTLDPAVRKVVEDDFLKPLEADYQKEKAKNSECLRESYLREKIRSLRRDEVAERAALGTRDIHSFVDAELDAHTRDKAVDDIESLRNLRDKEQFFSDDKAKDELQKSLDFFGTIEEKIDAGIRDACSKLQDDISAKLDSVFRTDAAKGGLSADALRTRSLDEIKAAYAKEQEAELVKKTLNVYFKEMPPLAQRQMIASETRHCMRVDANGNPASDGARLGALLKGAGPVMQKMLQGVNPERITDPDMQLALADMKDNLEPIPEKAIKAYLYDIVKQSQKDENPIESIKVDRSLGQASVGQALLCTLKRRGLEPEKVVVKLLRPNANLSARREHDIFKKVAQEMGNGMEATFKGRYKAIKAELDLSSEARNAQRGGKVYRYDARKTYNGQPFTNVTSAGLAPGFKPTINTMVQEHAEGVTLKKMLTEGMADLDKQSLDTLHAMQAKLQKTHASLTNLSYMWANEGLFGAGFYHGDLHEGNIVIDGNGKATVIDFGNATQLDDKGCVNVIRVVAGMAVSDVGIFLTGIGNLLKSDDSRRAFNENLPAIQAKIGALLEHRGIADTALRLDLALRILQMDFRIEVPSAVHNFLESQRRLGDAMVNTEAKLQAVNKALRDRGEDVRDEPLPSMMKCIIDVVKQNLGLKLLKAIGVTNANSVYESIKGELEAVDKPQGAPENVIRV